MAHSEYVLLQETGSGGLRGAASRETCIISEECGSNGSFFFIFQHWHFVVALFWEEIEVRFARVHLYTALFRAKNATKESYIMPSTT